jgi:hypothetical protein
MSATSRRTRRRNRSIDGRVVIHRCFSGAMHKMTKKKLKIGKSWKKLKKAMKNAGKKNKKVDREDARLSAHPLQRI